MNTISTVSDSADRYRELHIEHLKWLQDQYRLRQQSEHKLDLHRAHLARIQRARELDRDLG
jgi:uncharacterized protein YciI